MFKNAYQSLINQQNIDLNLLPDSANKYFLDGYQCFIKKNEDKNRNVCLIPNSAHGTNPATAAMAGFETFTKAGVKHGIITVEANDHGEINIQKLATNPNFKSFKVHTTEDMYQTVMNEFPQCDYFISAAAVSDIKFHTNSSKLKKDVISSSLNLKVYTPC